MWTVALQTTGKNKSALGEHSRPGMECWVPLDQPAADQPAQARPSPVGGNREAQARNTAGKPGGGWAVDFDHGLAHLHQQRTPPGARVRSSRPTQTDRATLHPLTHCITPTHPSTDCTPIQPAAHCTHPLHPKPTWKRCFSPSTCCC